jgi:hypothetical protein
MYGYFQQFKRVDIREIIEEPDFSSIPVQEFDWLDTVCGNIKEDIAKDTPKPIQKPVVLVSYVDANVP